MLDLALNLAGRAPTLLFIGAHCDDIEIGCGGTVIELLRAYPTARVHWVVLSSGGERAGEARKAADKLLRGVRNAHIAIADFQDCVFPAQTLQIKQFFENLKKTVTPDVVFAHHRDDLHQDHRVVGEVTWNTFRNHLILEYEIPKFDGGLGSPNVFVPISRAALKRKIALLMQCFPSQRSRTWFTPETFQGLMRIRGVECNAQSGYAEAFYARKVLLAKGARGRA